MATWTQEKRDNLARKFFGDPGNREYPIQDQDDVDSAAKLIGKAKDPDAVKKRIIRIAKSLKLSVPDAWAQSTKMSAADLSIGDLCSQLQDLVQDEYLGGEEGEKVADTETLDASWRIWVSPENIYPWQSKFVYTNVDGDLMQRGFAIMPDGTATLVGDPVEVQRVTSYKPVMMSLTFSDGGDDVKVWEGKLFEAGDYPDKGVTITPEQIAAMAANSAGAPLKIEHIDTPLDEALKGFGIDRLEAKGSELYGRVRVPSWLYDAMGEGAKKVSVGLAKTLDRIDELSLVRHPRVSSAALFSAYATFASQRHSTTDLTDIQKIHDLAAQRGAACKGAEMSAHRPNDPASAPHAPAKEKRMSLKEKMKAFFAKTDAKALQEAGIDPADLDKVEFKETTPPIDPTIQAKLDAMATQMKAMASARVDEMAAKFADEQLAAKKIVSAQRDHVFAVFKDALTRDGGGEIKFSESGAIQEGPNAKAVRDMFAQAPAHAFFSEMIPGHAEGGVDQALRERYLGSTPEGRQLLEGAKK